MRDVYDCIDAGHEDYVPIMISIDVTETRTDTKKAYIVSCLNRKLRYEQVCKEFRENWEAILALRLKFLQNSTVADSGPDISETQKATQQRVTAVEERIERIAKNSETPALPNSKAEVVANLLADHSSPEEIEEFKIERLRILNSEEHSRFLTSASKIMVLPRLDIDVTTQSTNEVPLRNYVIAASVFKRSQAHVSDFTFINFVYLQFGGKTLAWWHNLKLHDDHPLKRDWSKFIKFIFRTLLPADVEVKALDEFNKTEYSHPFEVWLSKLTILKEYNGEAPMMYRITDAMFYFHIYSKSPNEIRTEFLRLKFDHNTPEQDLLAAASKIEAAMESRKTESHSSPVFRAAVMSSDQDHNLFDHLVNHDDENLFSIDIHTVHGEDDMLCAVAYNNARLLKSYPPGKISEGAAAFKSSVICYKCGEKGHMMRDCTAPSNEVPWGSNSRMRSNRPSKFQPVRNFRRQQSAPFSGRKPSFLQRRGRGLALNALAEEDEDVFIENGGPSDLTYALVNDQLFLLA